MLKFKDGETLETLREEQVVEQIELLKKAIGPASPSAIIALLDRIVGMKSANMMRLMCEEFSKAGMAQALREVNRTLVLRMMLKVLTDFQKKEGHFPEFNKTGSTDDEFLLASWLHFQVNGPSYLFWENPEEMSKPPSSSTQS